MKTKNMSDVRMFLMALIRLTAEALHFHSRKRLRVGCSPQLNGVREREREREKE